MSQFDYSSAHPVTPRGKVPTNIEEGVDPYRLTTAGAGAEESAAHAQDGSGSIADAYSLHPDLEPSVRSKTKVFKEAAGELVEANVVLLLLEEYIKRVRYGSIWIR